MADTFTPLLRFIMQESLQNDNQWGGIFNSALTDLVDEALSGKQLVDLTFGDEVTHNACQKAHDGVSLLCLSNSSPS